MLGSGVPWVGWVLHSTPHTTLKQGDPPTVNDVSLYESRTHKINRKSTVLDKIKITREFYCVEILCIIPSSWTLSMTLNFLPNTSTNYIHSTFYIHCVTSIKITLNTSLAIHGTSLKSSAKVTHC